MSKKTSPAKRLPEYEKESVFEANKIIEAMRRYNGEQKRKPISVDLGETTIQDLKSLADKKKISYQVLLRMIIQDGIEKLKAVGE